MRPSTWLFKPGVLFVSIHIARALLLGVYIWGPDFWKPPHLDCESDWFKSLTLELCCFRACVNAHHDLSTTAPSRARGDCTKAVTESSRGAAYSPEEYGARIYTQSFQKSLIEEYALNYIGILIMVWGVFLNEGLLQALGATMSAKTTQLPCSKAGIPPKTDQETLLMEVHWAV